MNGKFVDMIFQEIGKPPKLQVAPKFLLRLMSLFNGDLREMMEMLYQFEEPFILDHSKFEQAFDMRPTPLREAIRRTLEWYRGSTQREQPAMHAEQISSS